LVAAGGPEARGNRIPDFSYCGYGGGGVAIPDAPVRVTLKPTDGADDDGARIQAAIDTVSALPLVKGFRGAVLLKRGVYRIAGSLRLGAAGIVLRGEGQTTGGTVIVATGTKKRTLIDVGGGRGPGTVRGTEQLKIADPYVPVGERTFRLASTRGLVASDAIAVVRAANDAWIRTLGMDRLSKGGSDPVRNWTPREYTVRYDRTVEAVRGTSIRIDAPIVCAVEAAWGGGYVVKLGPDGRIRNVGVERLRLVSAYRKGAEDSDEAHAWHGVAIGAVVDGWVRNVTAAHFGYSTVSVGHSASRITVQDSACLDPVSRITGKRRYSFNVSGQRVLVQRCYTRGGRHDYVTHARAPGPNVFLDCVADTTHSDSGPHHRWATGTLYDNIRCGELNVRNRGRSGTGHGWAGANQVFWNCRTSKIICDRPPTASNWAVGCTGQVRGSGVIESPGRPVQPRSLYLHQLAARLGAGAVAVVTIPAQRRGPIDDAIRAALSK